MKKLFGMIAAVAMVAAGVAPALAGDIELSGEVRVRHEVKKNMNWDDNNQDGNNTTSQRTRINAKTEVDDRTTAFISLADVRNWGEDTQGGAANQDSDGVHLNEGWLKINNLFGSVALKAGRQRLSYGKQRLLGALEWTDTGNRWDAFNFLYRSEGVDVDTFFAERSNSSSDCTETYTVDTNAANPLTPIDVATACAGTDHSLNGIYATIKNVVPSSKADVYVIQKTGAGEMDFMTMGLRVAGKGAGIDWDVEFMSQSGDKTKTLDQSAAAWVADLGYTLADVAGGLRIGAQLWAADGASGSDAAFDNLYPTNHFKYGISDIAGTNLSDREGMGISVTAKPAEGMKVKAEYLMVEAEASGVDIGTEINLGVWYSLTEKTKLYAYGVQFDPDDEYAANGDAFEKYGVQIHAKF